MANIRPIETRYKGWRFRSRLEARWAVYFDTVGLAWEYEPQGYDLGNGVCYLPDFYLPEVRSFAEVKPEPLSADEADKVRRLVDLTGKCCLLLVGSPELRAYDYVEPYARDGESGFGIWINDAIVSSRCLRERRLYTGTGGDPLVAAYHVDIVEAIAAARGARFER